jgi:D-inositol-3-phosphate glycosyltransferase
MPPAPPTEVAAWMRAADVVVVPSRREPLGLAAVEALACGTPVVASSVGGLREVVRDGENGLLIPPEDPGALAAALGRLADNGLRARLGAAGPASVAGHDIRAAAAQMAEVWAELGVRA